MSPELLQTLVFAPAVRHPLDNLLALITLQWISKF
jgi:hypothetical protein